MRTDSSLLKWTFGDEQVAPYLPDGSINIRAIAPADLGIALQPIVDAHHGGLFAYEALVRCKVQALQAPPALLALAEKQQACGPLGRAIREVAFSVAGDVPLFVNVHPEELATRWLVRPDDPIGFHSRAVYLEITEGAAFQYFDLCMSALREVCMRTGAKLVVDDFGAGYSNIQRLLELEPAVVKLDMRLVRGVHVDAKRRLAIRHIASLCADLGAKTVAEGVETVDELSCVRDLGVDWVQGYLLGRPAFPAPAVTWPLRSRELPAPVDASGAASATGHATRYSSSRPGAARNSVHPPSPIRPTRTMSVGARYPSSKPNR